jgi:hypothetical protein
MRVYDHGFEVGRLEGARSAVFHLGRKRFGGPDLETYGRPARAEDAAGPGATPYARAQVDHDLLDRMLTATSWDDLLRGLPERLGGPV